MKHTLTEQERQQLDRRIADAEKRTGSQIVLAVVERSDSYAELPWKAFALGTAGAGLAVAALDLLRPGWHSSTAVLLARDGHAHRRRCLRVGLRQPAWLCPPLPRCPSR